MASIKVQTFFTSKFFEIPKYQRGYAWEKSNIRDLFEDIQESIQGKSSHYIGTVVLSKSATDDDAYFVVDGQQRITTLTLIINELIRKLSPADTAYYERFYIKDNGRYRLKPLNRDQQFFINLLDGTITEPQNKSQRFLVEAMEEIRFKTSGINDPLLFLKTLEKLEIMEFVEDSEGDAIRIFQTVNDRGKPLSNMEKAKSLLIYFSNKYLGKKLDDIINNHFSDIFELYDDIKHTGEELGINLIKNRDFTEDNLMRYHFVTFSNENYDPTANYVLEYLKKKLAAFRQARDTGGDQEMETFIFSYITTLKAFFENGKQVIEKAKHEPRFFKLFAILNLSATLYPLAVKLQSLGMLEKHLSGAGRMAYTFFDMVELIEVRVYKTRGTDPKAHIARMVYDIDSKTEFEIEEWLIWFNNYWMSKEQFQSILSGNIYGNRALNHILVTYNESVNKKSYSICELKDLLLKNPTIEHILSQTPNFDPVAFGFTGKEDFLGHEHCLGNLTLLEKSLNSSVQNKNAIEKVETYDRSLFTITKKLAADIDSAGTFSKQELLDRTRKLSDYCLHTWWC